MCSHQDNRADATSTTITRRKEWCEIFWNDERGADLAVVVLIGLIQMFNLKYKILSKNHENSNLTDVKT